MCGLEDGVLEPRTHPFARSSIVHPRRRRAWRIPLFIRDRATRIEWETRAMETSFSGFPYDYARPYVDSSILLTNDRSLEGPIGPNFLFPEEELFPEHELQAVERGEVLSPLGRHEALMYAIRNFEEPSINVQNATTYPSTIFDNELAIPQGWDDDIMMRSISSCPTNFPEQYYSELLQNADASTVNMDLPDVNESDTIINQPFGLILKEEKQNTVDIKEGVDIKEDVISEITDNNKMMTDIKVKSEQETKEKELKCPSSNTLPVSRKINERNTNIRKKNQNVKGKRKKKENSIAIINKKVKLEEQEDVDVETVPKEEVPVLEAVDATSLLEKFEASQNSNPRNKLVIKNNRTYDTRSNKPCQVTQECRISVSEKSVSQASTLQKSARNSLSQDVLDKIKASGRKKTIPIIPAMPNIQGGNRRNSIRTQNRAPRNKILKTSSIVTNDAKSSTFSNISVQLDHDYCSSLPNFSVHTKSCNNNKTTKPISIQKSSQNKNSSIIEERQNSLTSNVYYNLKPVNGINRKAHKLAALQDKTMKDNLLENNHEDFQKETLLKQSHDSSNLSVKNINLNESSTFSATLQMPIRSALANRILQSSGMLPKTNIVQTNSKTQRMISVLKNPPNASQSPLSTNNSNENIVTTTNSLNNEVQNINVQSTQNTLLEVKLHEEVKTDLSRRVKISFEEYRIRKTSNKSPTQIPDPTEVVHIYTATTMTELIIKDDGNVEISCVRDIFPVIKKKSEIEAEKIKPKPPTCDAEAQTYETMFECSTNAVTDVMEKDEKKEESTKKEEQESCKKLSRSLSRSRSKDKSRNKTSRSRSRSRSRSKSRSRRRSRSRSRRSRDRKRNRSYSKSNSRSRSRSKSRTRSRNRNRSRSRNINTRSRSTTRSRSRSRNRSRSRSRRRSNTRRRTISHRRSSVSSTSSYSSRSPYSTKYSHSRSSSRSRNRSRSRSISRSRFTRQHYSSHSRNYNSRSPPSSNNFGRNRWSNHRERNPSDLERPYMYERSYSFVTTNHYRSRSRSPLRPYHKPYEYTYNKVKKKEIDERRVLYVGRINEGITKTDLRRRFEAFGPIVDVSLHFRERGDNYGFVTFEYRNDAFEAKEHGNDNPSLPRYDICFGGRRAFCNSTYADLDDMRSNTPRLSQGNEEASFDYLLMQAKSMMKENKRKA
ncbi:uncharacterized protein LOC112465010 isoform X1 [Temnothorax curvispinosus]|uniref:Uncharacterized protein LOC112465010 isoform X1 n=2 Tax=Temnothorax curvispinosus TaxID=300111 RepID=A0A6J1R0I4_9HYME|nr:uncharacterized protein LOC112465010 isoform X1 [Temnothorax curvispinosus]